MHVRGYIPRHDTKHANSQVIPCDNGKDMHNSSTNTMQCGVIVTIIHIF